MVCPRLARSGKPGMSAITVSIGCITDMPGYPGTDAIDPERNSWSTNWCVARGLFTLDVRRLDDRPPFLDFGLLERRERFRCLLVAWENLLTQIRKLLANTLIG